MSRIDTVDLLNRTRYAGVITSRSVDVPSPAPDVKYTAMALGTDGISLPMQEPHGGRPVHPDDPLYAILKIVPARVKDSCTIDVVGGEYRLIVSTEAVLYGECSETGGAA